MSRALLLLLFATAGCYSYTPVQSVRPGMEIRARLKTEAAVQRSQGLDDPIVRYDGIVVESTPSVLHLDVLIARSSSAFQDVVIRDTIQLESSEIQSLMLRKFSPLRSSVFTVGIGVAAFGVIKGIEQVVGGTGDPDDGTPQNMRGWFMGLPLDKAFTWLLRR
jgi:hypothetical protein